MSKEDIWDITNREQTQIKLDILKKYLKPWADIIGNRFHEAYYIDCFAGRGKYHKGGCTDCVPGSPLIALNIATDVQRKKQEKGITFKLKLIAVESNRKNFDVLSGFMAENNPKNEVEVILEHGNFIASVSSIVNKTGSTPTFFFIDPYGIKLTREALDFIINRPGPTEIFLNYMSMGIQRVAGLKKVICHKDEKIRTKAIKAPSNLDDLFGDNSWIDKDSRELLKHFVKSVLNKYRFVLNFDVPYPDRSGTFYNLIFATNNDTAQKIMKYVFTKKLFRGTLFENNPFEVNWNI